MTMWELMMRVVATGLIATALVDLWAVIRKRLFAIPSLDYRFVGRWIVHMSRGCFVHADIKAARPVFAEQALGWSVHYMIGMALTALPVLFAGSAWLQKPELAPALLAGIVSVCLPFFIMQPAFGMGVAASKTPLPARARFNTAQTHLIFGVSLYIAALVTSCF